ncbi:tRNA dimethylallyltransferase [Lachnospiraceae bacterium NE2001]|nr:tRNA dimethylallyltransferase [Lachnospiraceae bacterium NE2001]
MNEDKKKLIVLTGPTAVGKTDLSINLAKAMNGEIISADSAQVYKGLDIGSAKITNEEMQGVRHHLIDVYKPDFPFDVTVFKNEAKRLVDEITSRGNVPIVVGGTGFYIQALLYDIDFKNEEEDSSSREYRKELEDYLAETNDIDTLYDRLKTVDPVSAEMIHKNNHRKVIRALEFYHIHGTPISEHNAAERKKESVYDSRYYVLTMNRERLYSRIEQRVDIMRDAGLVDEVKNLRAAGYNMSMNSMQAIGYKEIFQALDRIDSEAIQDPELVKQIMDDAFFLIKMNTRHFAKRQMTWFRREKDVIWLDKDIFSDNYSLSSEETDKMILECILKDNK